MHICYFGSMLYVHFIACVYFGVFRSVKWEAANFPLFSVIRCRRATSASGVFHAGNRLRIRLEHRKKCIFIRNTYRPRGWSLDREQQHVMCDCVSSVLNFGAAGAADRGNKRNGARCKKSTCSRGCYLIKKITSCRLNEAQIITLVSKKSMR